MNNPIVILLVLAFLAALARYFPAPRWLRAHFPRLSLFIGAVLDAISTPSHVMGIGSGNFPSVYHKILGAIWKDESSSTEPVWKQYLQEKSTEKKFFDDVELVEPGLWGETDEGSDLDLDEYAEGITKRYEAKKFSKRLIIPEELKEDSQYPEIYDAVRMLRNTCDQTQDYDAVGILNDAFTGATDAGLSGDAVAICSTAHVIRGGGTVSNSISPTVSPSNAMIQAMLIMAEKMPGTNGRVRSIKLLKVVCPTNQKWRLKEVLKSEGKDDTSNRTINVLKGELSSDPVSVPHMSSTTNCIGITNVTRGGMFIWRRKPRFRAGNMLENETEQHTGSARWTKGMSNWRYFIGDNC
jgi:hypothetical protein